MSSLEGQILMCKIGRAHQAQNGTDAGDDAEKLADVVSGRLGRHFGLSFQCFFVLIAQVNTQRGLLYIRPHEPIRRQLSLLYKAPFLLLRGLTHVCLVGCK